MRHSCGVRGLSCPRCKGPRHAVTHTRRPAAGMVVRYRVCADCQTHFKTRETVLHVTLTPLTVKS